AEDGIRVLHVTGVQTCALPISCSACPTSAGSVSARSASKVSSSPARPAQDHAPRVRRQVESVTYSTVDPPGREPGDEGGGEGESAEERRVGKEGREEQGREHEE